MSHFFETLGLGLAALAAVSLAASVLFDLGGFK